jgi:hypothetical protein
MKLITDGSIFYKMIVIPDVANSKQIKKQLTLLFMKKSNNWSTMVPTNVSLLFTSKHISLVLKIGFWLV